ncbi:MAG: T9SS type A sorting domain-containing protein, partial [Candidatus Riflebacteria bacterium]|nr:T9SS type A sorting domain-containing protein [Candidatus Riflebacteria bacterium]
DNGTHSSSFRGLVKIIEKDTDSAKNTLKVSFGKRITLVSETDRNVRASIRYFPKAEIINFTAYPSPAKGKYINFRFFLNFPTGIKISIYDVSGKKLDSFELDGKEGENICRWDFPRKMANGVYIYRVKSLGTGESYTYAKMVKGKFAVLR